MEREKCQRWKFVLVSVEWDEGIMSMYCWRVVERGVAAG